MNGLLSSGAVYLYTRSLSSLILFAGPRSLTPRLYIYRRVRVFVVAQVYCYTSQRVHPHGRRRLRATTMGKRIFSKYGFENVRVPA